MPFGFEDEIRKTIRIESEKPPHHPHHLLGFSNPPGHYKTSINDTFSFTETILEDGHRITHPISTPKNKTKKEIWIFGCSFTFGNSLNDNETYPWLLQERLPEYKIVNFGVPGYGTTQSLIQFKEALKHKTPKIAILAYSDMHDIRNVYSRNWLKFQNIEKGSFFSTQPPYARFDEHGKLKIIKDKLTYREFPLMRTLSLSHFIEMKYNQYEDIHLKSHSMSEALVEIMSNIARKHDVEFYLVNILNTSDYSKINTTPRFIDIYSGPSILDFASEIGIPNTDISVDMTNPKNSNLPYDHHPSAAANRVYADKLETFIRKTIKHNLKK